MSNFGFENILIDIEDHLKECLDRCGFYYRIFSRVKSEASIKKKLAIKAEKYRSNGEKMQDIIGIRIACYFIDDVPFIVDELESWETNLPNSNAIEQFDPQTFKPQHLNFVFRMNADHCHQLRSQLQGFEFADLIDTTYEIQLRSVLSEGWHEVEHDLRYKCQDEWKDKPQESRMLNGIYATLETSERAMSKLFQDIAYAHFKKKNWAAMFRNHFFLKISDQVIKPEIKSLLDADNEIAKHIFRFSKKDLVNILFRVPLPFPLGINNLIFLINRVAKIDDRITALESIEMTQLLDKIETSIGRQVVKKSSNS